MKWLVLMLAGLILLGCSGGAQQTTPPWLLGRWQLSYNPQQDDNDILLFSQGGKVRIETEAGRSLNGHFLIQQEQLLLLVQIGQRSVETRFRISEAKDQLIFSNGAYYMKDNDGSGGVGDH